MDVGGCGWMLVGGGQDSMLTQLCCSGVYLRKNGGTNTFRFTRFREVRLTKSSYGIYLFSYAANKIVKVRTEFIFSFV